MVARQNGALRIMMFTEINDIIVSVFGFFFGDRSPQSFLLPFNSRLSCNVQISRSTLIDCIASNKYLIDKFCL